MEAPIIWKPPLEMVKEGKFLYVAAPMVRYSKLPFRLLCRKYGCDVAYTPMIIAKDFISSKYARRVEFTTNQYDRPLIVQFAANDPVTLTQAASFVKGYCEGIDINCGCPQKWVLAERYGSALLKEPDTIREMVRMTKDATGLPVSIKIRVNNNLRETIELVKRAESVGVAWITVHGRTMYERSAQPVNYEAVKLVKEVAQVPIFGNGHCFTFADAEKWKNETGVDGVMAARGLLDNPALFAGYDVTPPQVITDWCDIALSHGVKTHILHQHLMFMCSKSRTREERRIFNSLRSVPSILSHLETNGYQFSSYLPFHS